jgi:outer membrane protein OmpA-like peptidoglycan-associated protein
MKKLIFILALYLFITDGCYSQTIGKDLVYFEFDKYDLTKDAIHNLDSLSKLITKYAAKVEKIEIGGHCDSMGEHSYNDHLSNQRATAVNDYLISKGVKDSLIKHVDYFGKRKPITNNNDSIERAKNRRVEITVYWIKSKAVAAAPTSPKVNKDGYIQHKAIRVKLEDLSKIADLDSNSTIVLPNLNFYGGRHQIISTAYPTLEKLLDLLRENPTIKIELQGHVCCQEPGAGYDGFDWDNEDNNLSLNRARAIYDYLVSEGIDRNRLAYKGFGGGHKLVPEITEEDRQTNRRVEVKLISK